MKKLEFSKILTVIAIIIFASIAVWSIIEYYTLVKLAIMQNSSTLPDATLPVTCITTIIAAIVSYCLYQFGLKNSRNKYGVDCDGQPFKEKIDYDTTETDDDKISVNINNNFPEQIPKDCDYNN